MERAIYQDVFVRLISRHMEGVGRGTSSMGNYIHKLYSYSLIFTWLQALQRIKAPSRQQKTVIETSVHLQQNHGMPLFPPTTETKLAERRSHWRSNNGVLWVTLSPSLRRFSILSARFRPGH